MRKLLEGIETRRRFTKAVRSQEVKFNYRKERAASTRLSQGIDQAKALYLQNSQDLQLLSDNMIMDSITLSKTQAAHKAKMNRAKLKEQSPLASQEDITQK